MKLAIGRCGAGRPPGLRPLLAAALATVAIPAAAHAQPPAEMQYELVSPLASRGFDFTRTFLAPDGERALVGSELSDVNGLYPVLRTPAGWQQQGRRALTPPNGTPLVAAGVADTSADGTRVLVSAVRTAAAGPQDLLIDRLAINEADGSWTLVGGGIRYVDGTADLSRLVVHALWSAPDESERFPGVPGRETGVFLWQDDGSDDGAVVAIGADVDRLRTCGAQVPDERGNRALEQTGVAPDARTVVLSSTPGCADPDDGTPLPSHVYVWHDGATTDISAPAAGPDGDARFVGASSDLGAVFFTTDLALDPADANGAADLYRWDAATGARTRLSGAVTDGGEQLTSALAADGGDRVWFATVGAGSRESLWTAARGGAPRAIASATEPAYPIPRAFDLASDGMGANNLAFPTQATPDGETLVFTTRTPIDGAGGFTTGAGDDPGQLFRATADGAVDCLSCLADGAPAERVAGGSRWDGLMNPGRVVSDDGRWVAFQSDSRLDPADVNDLPDVYLWHDGTRYLLSAGSAGIRADLGNVDRHGDVLFKTYAQLLPWIDDDHLKAYVARIGGGLPAPVDPRQPCRGDACQAPAGPAPPADPPSASELFEGPADSDAAAKPFPATPALRLSAPTAAQRRALARGRAITLTARATRAGRVTATVSWRAGRRWARADRAARTLRKAGTAKLSLRLSRAARAQLARRGALRVQIDVTHSRVAAPRRVAFVIRSAR